MHSTTSIAISQHRNQWPLTYPAFEYKLREAIPLNSLVLHTIYSYVKLDGGTLGAKHVKRRGKGKAIPLQTWTGPEGSRRLRLPD